MRKAFPIALSLLLVFSLAAIAESRSVEVKKETPSKGTGLSSGGSAVVFCVSDPIKISVAECSPAFYIPKRITEPDQFAVVKVDAGHKYGVIARARSPSF